MTSLTILEYGEIRVTDDGRYSVYDTLFVLAAKKNPRDAWKNLCEQYPEVVVKTDYFQFPGAGQRPTPVANTEDILYIIGLLPGAVGHAYREDAAKMMIAKIKGSSEQVKTGVFALPLPEQRAKFVFDFAKEILSRSSKMSHELQDVYALRAVGSQIPECSQMTELLIGAIQESTATSERHLSPTELGKLYAQQRGLNKPIQPSVMNLALESAGLQRKDVVVKTDKHTGKEHKKNIWHLTEAGKEYGVVIKDKAFGHDKTVESVRWLPNVLQLIELN
ncbi:hypothetical protein AB0758_49335 [Tolypothrix bouteillei VB521301_2]